MQGTFGSGPAGESGTMAPQASHPAPGAPAATTGDQVLPTAERGEPDPRNLPFLDPARARQQPDWGDPGPLHRARTELAALPGLVRAADVAVLRTVLARVADGRAHVIQAGDCAEDLTECTADHVARKTGLLDLLAGTMKMSTRKPVVRVGRIAGQFAKPRSQPTERVAGQELAVFRGHMVNAAEPSPEHRRPDPRRMLSCYRAAREVMDCLGWGAPGAGHGLETPVWTSHEALVLDYEVPLLRRDETGRLFLGSTHWPWIGERTRQVDGPHVALLAAVANPVACKVGPGVTDHEIVELCARLDPDRQPGRLTLIARMGASAVADRLPDLVRAVHAQGHPVIWLSDPMHGNTLSTPDGVKTRYVQTVLREAEDFQCAVRAFGAVAGGLHLEVTPDAVTECVANEAQAHEVGTKYTTLCDPRLNPTQSAAVVATWRA